jgi:hypothetical protein
MAGLASFRDLKSGFFVTHFSLHPAGVSRVDLDRWLSQFMSEMNSEAIDRRLQTGVDPSSGILARLFLSRSFRDRSLFPSS